MPAFSFEKISPPVRREAVPVSVPVASPKPVRGLIVQMLDRLTEARLRRSGVTAATPTSDGESR
ncbi:hypothetical protein JQ557_10185 [Bradyrhizobium sp. U87765 SZCCT0131]|uniref:hypothetical protein n=1 Tax=unclassified Bradyrhizobium TaxID=2631580 RepID=UPI001BA9E773|nr:MULTISPECIES: hypothetical protein [unclassified Bradyrhizobium]MBR1218358.1 hypothetical protein [Bradyrhizobium sp. U87765 SZCCT0131]MBR1260696.1 hypothetical protein [Bradyrhizobium sp. U87765 SZCCT0134]MBR1303856.1 hypothetical protein [Bradyrhizobium sp. U87765 SZCCT0110]MBR1319462.1 hypothetical protein [Bradyrhizobium sp. U87765 SZCCT0109]MBR1347787.1 hypothetical protein [Bradyrhizobium sp. U87765 SZCCT0048]